MTILTQTTNAAEGVSRRTLRLEDVPIETIYRLFEAAHHVGVMYGDGSLTAEEGSAAKVALEEVASVTDEIWDAFSKPTP